MTPRHIMLPSDPGFQEILYSAPPPDKKALDSDIIPFGVGVDGMPRAFRSEQEFKEYLWGGEYDEMMAMAGEEDSLILEES